MITRGVRYMLLASFFFALMNVAVKSLGHLPAVEIAFIRSAVSLMLSLGLIRAAGIALPGKNVKGLLLRGFFGAFSLILFFITLQHMPLATAVTIQYLSPIFASLMAMIALKERVLPLQWLFFAIAFTGVVVVQGFDGGGLWLYLGVAVASALFAGLAYTMIRQLKDSEHPLLIIFYFPLVSLPVSLAFTLTDWTMPSGWDWPVLVFVGLSAQAAQYFMTRSYQEEDLSKVASLKYVGIIYALLFGYFLFGESFTLQSYAGMALVLVGVSLNLWYRHQSDPEAPRND
jgi:drug/metabolite transporter (DMT)-like permease